MNRLQKKCVFVTVGFHLLLLVILIVGPGFFAPKPKANDLQILDVIPANLIDAAFNSGVRNAQPPPPAPQPVVTPPTPPKVETPAPIKEIVKALTPEPKPVEKAPVGEKPKIQINTQLVTRAAPKNSTTPDNSQQQQRQARAIKTALQALRSNLSSGTTIDLPGNSSAAYANYAAVVKSVYERTLNSFLPNEIANDNENTKVSVTIASDGTVISARIITPSGDPIWDAAVQHTLDRVTYVAPFPEGATEKERHYTINFNPKVERTLE